MTERVLHRLAVLACMLGWMALRWFPWFLSRPLCRVVAEAAWLRRGAGVRQLAANLSRATGGSVSCWRRCRRVRRLTRAALRSYCRYWVEVFRLPAMSREYIVSRFYVRGEGLLWSALRSGRGVILALPHSGNWDHAGAWLALSGYPFTTVAQRLRPEPLYARFVAFRERLGMEVLPLTGGADDVYSTLARRLAAGGVVCLLADRDLTATGVEVTFFGERARMPAGPAALTLDTGAALLPVTLWYEGAAWAGQVHPEVVPPRGTRAQRIAAMTQTLAAAFEDSVAAHPQDWHMMQRLWAADLDDRARLSSPTRATGTDGVGPSGGEDKPGPRSAPQGGNG